MNKETINEVLAREPFRPAKIRTSDGREYVVQNPHLVVAMQSNVFYAYPDSDKFVIIPLLHICSVEVVEHAA